MDDVTGTYTGNGTTQEIGSILGFVPTLVVFTNTVTGVKCVWRNDLADDTVYSQESGEDVLVESEGVTLVVGGVSVGSYYGINDDGVDFNYYAEDAP